MNNLMNKVNAKLTTAQFRATEALKNNDGMEVIQFLGVALLSITIAAALYTGLKGSVDTHISTVTTKLSELFK